VTQPVLFRIHAVQRMFERAVSFRKVLSVVNTGEVIEDYTVEMSKPGRLQLGFQGKRPIHVVTSRDPETGVMTIVTVYIPDADQWTKDFTSRRS
jgi:hypothetical protein